MAEIIFSITIIRLCLFIHLFLIVNEGLAVGHYNWERTPSFKRPRIPNENIDSDISIDFTDDDNSTDFFDFDTLIDFTDHDVMENRDLFKQLLNIQPDIGPNEGIAASEKRFLVPAYLNIKKNNISKRMESIKKSASDIASTCFKYSTENNENLLKGYLLKLWPTLSAVPSYGAFVNIFCKNKGKVPEKYYILRIPNHPLIDDVLFTSDFNDISINDLKNKMKRILSRYSNKLQNNDIEIYQNSPLLQSSLRLQDFIILRMNLRKNTDFTEKIEKRVNVALYRLALRECDETFIHNQIKLFLNTNVYNIEEIINNLFDDQHYRFDRLTEISLDETFEIKTKSKLFKKTIQLKIEMELLNPVGMPNVDRILNTSGIFIVPPNTTFPVQRFGFLNNNTFFIKIVDNRSMEEKMIDTINKLYNLVTISSELFYYY